nr:ABC transporter permease subunit [Clostridia bacterium]
MVSYIVPKQFSLDNYKFLFQGAAFSFSLLVKDTGAIIITALTNLAGIATIVSCLVRKPKNPLEKSKGNFKAAILILLGVIALNLVRCIDSSNCDFVRWFMNTLTIALFCAVIQTIMQLSVSYTLSRMRFKGRKLLMNVCLVLGMFPGFLTMIVLYYLLKMLGLTQAGAIPGLILISCASSGMGYYISKGFFDTVPKSLDESARIDGATRFQVFLKIIMPMAKPIVIYTILMAFMGPWGDYVFASYVAFGHKASYNVAVGLYRWVNTNDYQGYFTRFCAGGVLVAIPITVLFMCLQKYYVEGVTGGAVKG